MFPLVLAGLSQHSNELISLKEMQLLLKSSPRISQKYATAGYWWYCRPYAQHYVTSTVG